MPILPLPFLSGGREACNSIKAEVNFTPADTKVTHGRYFFFFSDGRNYDRSISHYLEFAFKELLKLVPWQCERQLCLKQLICSQIQDKISKDTSWLKCAQHRSDLDLLIIYLCSSVQLNVHNDVQWNIYMVCSFFQWHLYSAHTMEKFQCPIWVWCYMA